MIRILILYIVLLASTAFAGWSPIGPYGGEITSISVAKDGIYIGTEGGGVFYSADGGKNWEGRRKGLEDAFVESLAEAKDGTLYAGTRDGIFRSRDGRVWEPLPSVPRGSAVKNMTFDPEGNLYVSLWGSGVYVCKKDSECSISGEELSSQFVNKIIPMGNGDVVAATEGGVFLKPKGEEKWRPEGLTKYAVSSMALDNRGILYAGTRGGGVNYFENGEWRVRGKGLAGSIVAVLERGYDNNLYAGTEGGVSVLAQDSDTWSTVGLEKTFVKALGFGRGGEIYAGSYGKGFIVKEKDKDWEGRSRGICNSNIISIAVSDKGGIFAGTREGLYISQKGDDSWIEVSNLHGMKVNALLIDGEQAYAGTSGGLFAGSSSEKEWRRVDGEMGYMPVTSLTKVDPFIYAGTESGGVFRGEAGKGEFRAVNGGLENLRVRSLITVDNANVYAGTGGGVYVIQKGMTSWVKAGMQDSVIVSLAVNGGTVFAAAENKGVFTFVSGRWASVDGALPNKRILSISHTGKALYASGYGWVASKEGEGPWRDVTGELSSTAVQAVAADRTGKVYVGTSGSGIWRFE